MLDLCRFGTLLPRDSLALVDTQLWGNGDSSAAAQVETDQARRPTSRKMSFPGHIFFRDMANNRPGSAKSREPGLAWPQA